jgi:hypothetical protein
MEPETQVRGLGSGSWGAGLGPGPGLSRGGRRALAALLWTAISPGLLTEPVGGHKVINRCADGSRRRLAWRGPRPY